MVSLVGDRGTSTAGIVLIGLWYGVLLSLANQIHSLGHIVASKLIGAPMDAILMTATRNVNLHLTDQSQHPKGVHVRRALGGPSFNLVIGLLAFALTRLWESDGLTMFALFNVLIGLFTLIPIPSIDGWVIWGELLGFRRRS
jgi:Zn-dependent protease